MVRERLSLSLSLSLLYSKPTYPTYPMSLNAAAGVSTVLGLPLAAVPVGQIILSAVKSFRPNSKLKKWIIRIEHISDVVASKRDMITPEEMDEFLRLLGL